MLLDVEHVKAHRSKKEKHNMTLFEQFVAKGNERVDELAKGGALWDGGEMTQITASTVQQEEEKRFPRACSKLPAFIVGWRSCTTVKSFKTAKEKWCSLTTRRS